VAHIAFPISTDSPSARFRTHQIKAMSDLGGRPRGFPGRFPFPGIDQKPLLGAVSTPYYGGVVSARLVKMATVKGRQVLTNIYLEPEVYAALKKLSVDTGAPMAFYLRKAVERVLAEHGVKVVKSRSKR
jgi:ribbon-helix-helix protein